MARGTAEVDGDRKCVSAAETTRRPEADMAIVGNLPTRNARTDGIAERCQGVGLGHGSGEADHDQVQDFRYQDTRRTQDGSRTGQSQSSCETGKG